MSQRLDYAMSRTAKVGYTYYVSDEQLIQYATLTALERLTWLDQARRFVLLAETEQTARRRAWLRNERAGVASLQDA